MARIERLVNIYDYLSEAISAGALSHHPPTQRHHRRGDPRDHAVVSPQRRPGGGHVGGTAPAAVRCCVGLAAGAHHAADPGGDKWPGDTFR